MVVIDDELKNKLNDIKISERDFQSALFQNRFILILSVLISILLFYISYPRYDPKIKNNAPRQKWQLITLIFAWGILGVNIFVYFLNFLIYIRL